MKCQRNGTKVRHSTPVKCSTEIMLVSSKQVNNSSILSYIAAAGKQIKEFKPLENVLNLLKGAA